MAAAGDDETVRLVSRNFVDKAKQIHGSGLQCKDPWFTGHACRSCMVRVTAR